MTAESREAYDAAVLAAQARLHDAANHAEEKYHLTMGEADRLHAENERRAWEDRAVSMREAREEYDKTEREAWNRYLDTANSAPLGVMP